MQGLNEKMSVEEAEETRTKHPKGVPIPVRGSRDMGKAP